MKRFREIVFSLTEPTDKEVIWIYPVRKPEENDLKVETIQVEEENFDTIYQVKIWGNDGWENVLKGSLEYIRSQMEFKIEKVEQYCDTLDDNIGDIADKIGEVPEGTTIMGAINNITGGSSISLDSLNTQLGELTTVVNGHTTAIAGKVDIDETKQLSDENFTSALKTKLENITAGFMTYKGIESASTDLPASGNTEGDVYLVGSSSPYIGYIWNGTAWDTLGQVADMSNFYTKAEIYSKEQTYSKTEIDTAIAGATTNVNVRTAGTTIDVPLVLFDQTIYNDNTPLEDVQSDGHFRAEITNYSQVQAALAEDFDTSILHLGGYQIGATEGNVGVLNLKQASYNKFLVADINDANSRVYKLPDLRGYTLATGDCATLAVDFEATTSKKGLMSASDKTKLNNLDTTIENAVSAEITTQIQSVGGVVPIGGIIMWSGQENAIDTTKWALCNGQTVNGHITPDLRGKFIMSSTYGETVTFTPVTPTGDNESETIKANTNAKTKVDPILVNGINKYGYFQHKITANEISHTHKIETDSYEVRRTQNTLEVIKDTDPEVSIYHMTNTSKVSFVPPYYVLAFIMRIA